MQLQPFHLAIAVRDIAESRNFYGGMLGLREGRSADVWVDWNLYGHQLVTHLDPSLGPDGQVGSLHNPVDGDAVPVPHFGVVLKFDQWQALADRLSDRLSGFLIEPRIRFRGEPGEQGTMFFLDPSGNALEFKAFRDIESQLFAH
jgi:extradiol dioxygenase family protein